MDLKKLIALSLIDIITENKTSKITVTQLCDTAGVSRTTFYKHFKDVYEVIEYIFIQDAMRNMDMYVKNKLNARIIMENWFASFCIHKEFYRIAIAENGQNSLIETIISLVEEYNRKIFSTITDDETELEYCAYKYSVLQVMLMKKWMLDGMKIPPEKIAKIFLTDYIGLQF